MENQRSNKRAFLGLILVLVGIALIVSNFNLFPFGWRPYLFSWQALLILLGLFFLLSREAKATGWILIFIGGFFIIPRLWNIPWGWDVMFWPALLRPPTILIDWMKTGLNLLPVKMRLY